MSEFRGLAELAARLIRLKAETPKRTAKERDAKLKSIREKTAKIKSQIKILEAV